MKSLQGETHDIDVVEDLVKAGVIDSAKVSTAEALVSEIEDEGGGNGGGGMGESMGGMY